MAICAVLALPGCSSRPSAPQPSTPTGHLSVEVAARAGGPAAGAQVAIESVLPVNGAGVVRIGPTDAAGRITFMDVPAVGYIVSASSGDDVAADSARVDAGVTRTLSVALVLPSRVHGRATLFNRSSHAGTAVRMDGAPGATAITDSAGDFTLDGAAPGTWTVSMVQPGFTIQTRVATIPAEDSDVTLPDVELPVDPSGP